MLRDTDDANEGWDWEPDRDDRDYVVQFEKETYVGPPPKREGDLKPMLIADNYKEEKRYLARNGASGYYEASDLELAKWFDSYALAAKAIQEYRDQYGEYAGHRMKIVHYYDTDP